MPIFRQHLIFEVTKGLKAFLNLEGGVVRAGTPPGRLRADASQAPGNGRALRRAERRLEKQDLEIAELRAQLGANGTAPAGGVRPENIIWMFSDGRSGSTWLASLMGALKGFASWREPNVGTLFGMLYYGWANDVMRAREDFVLGPDREVWLSSIRGFVLNEIRTRFPDLSKEDYLLVKEPYGSIGAPLLMEALPESRMVFLLRDPRDVVASAMDAQRKGGWSYANTKAARLGAESPADKNPDAYVAERAKRYLRHVGNSREAYEAHKGPKALLRYEELREDTLGTMKRVCSDLGIQVNEQRLARAVDKRDWDNIPDQKKGEGKFHRKATPGGWQEDLTPEQAKAVEKITAPLLEEFYPNR